MAFLAVGAALYAALGLAEERAKGTLSDLLSFVYDLTGRTGLLVFFLALAAVFLGLEARTRFRR